MCRLVSHLIVPQSVANSCDNDITSVSSTVDVHANSHKNPEEHEQEAQVEEYPHDQITTTLIQRVRFDLFANVEHANTIMCKEDTKELWYSTKQVASMRKATVVAAKKLSQSSSSKSRNQVLVEMYKQCCRSSSSSSADDDDDSRQEQQQQHVDKSLSHFASLAAMSATNASYLGLERLAVAEIRKEARLLRTKLPALVARIKQRQQQQRPRTPDAEEVVRHVCQKLTQPSRLFAQALASALAESRRNDAIA